MPFKFKPIREDEALSWDEFLEAVAAKPPRVSEPQPLTFAAKQGEPAQPPAEAYSRVENLPLIPQPQTRR